MRMETDTDDGVGEGPRLDLCADAAWFMVFLGAEAFFVAGVRTAAAYPEGVVLAEAVVVLVVLLTGILDSVGGVVEGCCCVRV